MNLTIDEIRLPEANLLAPEDKWLLHRFNQLVAGVRNNLDKYEVGVALASVYDFTWDVFCDWYIELAKARLNDKESAGNAVAQNVLCYVLTGTLKLLHPFMPFITEEIYQALPHVEADAESIVIAAYPKADEALSFPTESAEMSRVISAIKAIRLRRNEMNVVPSRKAKVYIATAYAESFGASTHPFFVRLASASDVTVADVFSEDVVSADNAVQIITDSATVYLPLSDLVDTEKERARLEAEQKELVGEIDRLDKKLSNEGFVAKAPEAVVNQQRELLNKTLDKIALLEESIAKIKAQI
jgi:valyl-tRNA synthetase